MLRKNIDQIINACLNAKEEYDELCRGFLGTPGQEGINRKVNFLILVSGLKKNTPEEAFIKLYDFYSSQNLTSRLNKLIEEKLMWILDIPKPELTGGIFQDLEEIVQALENLHNKAANLKSEMGITAEGGILLMSQ